MHLYIDHDGRTIGPFSLEEINAKLAQGEITASTMAWFQGWADWIPLSQIPGVITPEASPRLRALPRGDAADGEHPEQDTQAPTGADTLDDPFYRQVASAFCTATTRLIKPFDDLGSMPSALAETDINAFFNAFLKHATQFNDECPLAFATALRYSTVVDSVRGTTTKQLAKEIRDEAFESLDEVLRAYFSTMADLNDGLRSTARALRRIQDESDYPLFLDLKLRGENMAAKAERFPAEQVNEYFACLVVLPIPLIDYLSAKCFGGAVDLQKQQACVELCTKHCEQMAGRAARSVERMKRRNDELARQPKRAPQLPRLENRFGCGGFFCVALALLGIAILCDTLLAKPERPQEGDDADEMAQVEQDAKDDWVYGIGWGVGLISFGVAVPLHHGWKINCINRARGY